MKINIQDEFHACGAYQLRLDPENKIIKVEKDNPR